MSHYLLLLRREFLIDRQGPQEYEDSMPNQILRGRFKGGIPAYLFATILLLIFPVASLQAQTEAEDVPELIEDLNSTDPAVRGSAAAALDNLHDPAAVSMLVAALRHSSNSSATAALVRTLGRFDDANAVAAMADLLSTDAGVIASQHLLQMGKNGTQAAVGALASDDERIRANVSEAFKSHPDLSLKILPAVLRTSKSAKQREQIVGVLADSALEYEDPPRASFVEGFLPGASDAVPSVRIAVASAVQQLADREKELADSRFGPPDFTSGWFRHPATTHEHVYGFDK